MALEPNLIKSKFAKRGIIIAVLCSAVVGCGSPPSPISPGPNGKVSLRYERIVTDGGRIKDVFFVLENRSLRTVYFRGIETPSSGTYPVYSALDCAEPEPNVVTIHNFPTVDFLQGPPPWIQVPPTQWVRLNLHGGMDVDSVLINHGGAPCEARVQLKDGEVLKSEEFHGPFVGS